MARGSPCGRRRCGSLTPSICCCSSSRAPGPGPGGAAARAPVERIGFPGLAFLAGAPVSRGPLAVAAGRAPVARARAADRRAGAAAGAARGAADPEQVAQHHGRARHLEQHEGGRLQAGQPADGRAQGAGRLRPRAPGRPARAGDLRRAAPSSRRRSRPTPICCSAMLGRVDIGMLPDGTAIGTALAMASPSSRTCRPRPA